MTKQERRLWYEFLRYYPAKVYKQKIIGGYIVDFYCHSAKLVIEIDGGQHYTEDGIEYDEARTSELNSLGLKVIRFTNYEVNDNFGEVCKIIEDEITARRELPVNCVDTSTTPDALLVSFADMSPPATPLSQLSLTAPLRGEPKGKSLPF